MPNQEIYQDNDTFYPVGPKSKEKFLEEHPNAKVYQSTTTDLYSHNGKFYPVGPKSEEKFLKDNPGAILVKKKDQNSPTDGSQQSSSPSPTTSTKKVPSDITTNLAPSNIFGPLQSLADKVKSDADKGQSGDDSPYKQAQQDLAINNKYQEYMQQFKSANSNPDIKPLATPRQAMTPEEWGTLQRSSAMNQMQHSFLTDPLYLDKKNRDKYYDSLPGMSKESIDYMKEQGESFANKQRTYNFQRDMAVKYPTPDNLAAMGSTQMEVGDTLTAYKTFQHIKDINPDAPQYYQGMAALSYKHGKALEAVKFMDEAIDRNPTDAGSYSLRAQYYANIGKSDQAMSDAANAIHFSKFGTKQSIDAYSVRAQLRHDNKDYTGSSSDYAKAKAASDIYNQQYRMASENITPEIQTAYSAYSKKYNEIYEGKREVPSIETFASFYNNNPKAQTEKPTDDDVAGLTTFDVSSKQNEYQVKHTSTGLTGIITHPVDYLEQHANAVGQGLGNTLKGVEAITNDSFNPNSSAKDVVNDALKTVVSGAGTALNIAMLTSPVGIATNVGIESAEKTKIGKETIDEAMGFTGRVFKKVSEKLGAPEDVAKNIGDVANIVGQYFLFKKGSEIYKNSVNAFKQGYNPLFDFKTEESQDGSSVIKEPSQIIPNDNFIPKLPELSPSSIRGITAEDAINNNAPLDTQQINSVASVIESEKIEPTEESKASEKWILDQKTKFYSDKPVEGAIRGNEILIPSINLLEGEKAPVLESTEGALKNIIDNSKNPGEILEAYLSEKSKNKSKTEDMIALSDKFKDLTGKYITESNINELNNGVKYSVIEGKEGIDFEKEGVKIRKGTPEYARAIDYYEKQKTEYPSVNISQTRLSNDKTGILPAAINNDAFGDHRQALISGSKIMPDGSVFKRQDPLSFKEGNWKSFIVSDGKQVKAIYSLIPKNLIKGNEEGNFLRFSRPQNRVIRDIYGSEQGGVNPSMMGISDNVHTGAPLVNERGEVLQGFGRSSRNLNEDYYDYLKTIESETGVKTPKDAQEKGLILVRKTKISDLEAMDIMQKTTLDMHPEKFGDVMAGNMEGLSSDKLSELNNIMTGRGLTLEDALEKNGIPMVKWFVENGLMSEHDANKIMVPGTPESPPTSLNSLGMDRFKGLFRSIISKDAHPDFSEYLKVLPSVIKEGLDMSSYKILAMGENSPLEHIQTAVMILGDHKIYSEIGGSLEDHISKPDEYNQKVIDHLQPEDLAFARILNGMQYPNDLPYLLDSINIALNGDLKNGIAPVSLKDFLDVSEPESSLDNGNNFLNSLYGKPEGAESSETFKGSEESNASQLRNGDEAKPQREENDQNAREASTRTKDIQRIVEEGIPNANNIKSSSRPIEDNLHMAGISGSIGSFIKRSELASNYLNGMTALHFLDNLKDIQRGTKIVDDNRLADMYNKLLKKYPEIGSSSVKKEARYYSDRMTLRPEEAGLTKPLSPEAQLLVHIETSIYTQFDDIIKKAQANNILPESLKYDLGKYRHREALQYSKFGKEAKRQMQRALKGQSITDMAMSLDNFFIDEEKSGMTIKSPDFFNSSREYYEAIDREGNAHIIKLDSDDNNAYLWRNHEMEYGGKPIGRFNDKNGNGDVKSIVDSGVFKDSAGQEWKVRQALQEDIEKHTLIEYVNDPIYSAIQAIKVAQDLLRSSDTLNSVANSKELKPFVKALDPVQKKAILPLMDKWNNDPLARKGVSSELKKMGFQDDLFDKYNFIPKGQLPQQFDNLLVKNGTLEPFKTAMQSVPPSSAKAANLFLQLAVYQKLFGTVHPINIGVLGLENLVSGLIDPALYKGARMQYVDLAWKTSGNPTGPATSQMMRAGLNLFDNTYSKSETDMIKDMVIQHMSEHKEFQEVLKEIHGNDKWDKIKNTLGYEKGDGEIAKQILMDVAHTISDWELKKPQNFVNHNMVIRELGKTRNLSGVKDLDQYTYDILNAKSEDPEVAKAQQIEKDKLVKDYELAVNNYNMRAANYKIPSHVLFPTSTGAKISRALHNRYISIFSGYSYSKARAIKNDIMAVMNSGIPNSEEQVLNNKKATTAGIKLAVRGLLLAGLIGITEHLLNRDDKEKTYNKTPYYGDLKEIQAARDFLSTTQNESVSKAFVNEFPLSPVIQDAVGVWNNKDYFGNPIYDPNGSTINTLMSAVKYMNNGGSVNNMLSHVHQSDKDALMEDLEKVFFGISHTHFTPKQWAVAEEIKYYNSTYKKEFAQKKALLQEDKSDKTTQATLNSWMNDMKNSEKGLINTDYAATLEIIDGLKSGYYSPLAESKDALDYWQKHLKKVETMKSKKDKDNPYTKQDVLDKYKEISVYENEINSSIHRK